MVRIMLLLISGYIVGNILTNFTTQKDIPEVALVYEIGADSANYLGFRYYNGEGVKQNVDSALFWIRKAAEGGDIKGAGNLGYLLSMAPEIEHDYPEAIKWLTKASDAGLPSAQSQLADLFRIGLGIAPDTIRAMELYEKSGKGGLIDAQYKLIAMMGYKWKLLPADSSVNLGLYYHNNRLFGVAAELFMDAAEKDNPRGNALIGDALARGEGISYNSELAMEYFLKAALGGNASASFTLAEFLEFYPDSLRDERYQAIINKFNEEGIMDNDLFSPQFWYEKASKGGVVDSQTAFRNLYGD